MSLRICEKRQQVLDAAGHVLVTGGPGSGKTTIALLKALRRIEQGLGAGRAVLFLSFSRAAVARIAEEARKQIPKAHERDLHIQTFHSFFWEILRSHGYLLGAPKPLRLLLPHDEKALSNGIERADSAEWRAWVSERERLFQEEGRACFDLFAPKAAELLSRCRRIRDMIAARYPLIIVDESQDTGPEQWACVRLLSEKSQTICLADLDQQIFDFLPGVGPERVQEIEKDLAPLGVHLGAENNRSPDSEIAAFGYDILMSATRRGPYKGVSQMNFHPRADVRDRAIRQSIGIVKRIVESETGRPPQSIALLASYDRGAAMISNALLEAGTPIPHKVLFNEASTLLSSRLLAFLLEPKKPTDEAKDLARCLELLSAIFRANGSATALKRSKALMLWAAKTLNGGAASRASLYVALLDLLRGLQSFRFSGDPRTDWTTVRRMLRETSVSELMDVDRNLQYLVTFSRGKRIAASLASAWGDHGAYVGARRAVDSALAEDQLLSGAEDLSGIHVMTMHKSKGKQFDAVVVFRYEHASPFVWPGDQTPHRKSRKVLRVAITRARVHTMILNQAFPTCPIMSDHALSSPHA